MDVRTSRFYSENHKELISKYDQVKDGISRYFQYSFNRGETILDIGAGTCRDILNLLNKGFDAYGVEPCAEFVEYALKKNPILEKRVKLFSVPFITNPFSIKFDSILCSAVFMHLSLDEVEKSVKSFDKVLKRSSKVLISFSTNRDGLINNRDQYGRYFNDLNNEKIISIFNNNKFYLKKDWTSTDSLGRNGLIWNTLLFCR